MDWNHCDEAQVEDAAGTVTVARRQQVVLKGVTLFKQLRLLLQQFRLMRGFD